MTLADEKTKLVTDRAFWLRLTPAVNLSDFLTFTYDAGTDIGTATLPDVVRTLVNRSKCQVSTGSPPPGGALSSVIVFLVRVVGMKLSVSLVISVTSTLKLRPRIKK